MKTIAIVDTLWIGHHPTYLKLFTKTLLQLGCRVIAFCPNPYELSEWTKLNCPEKLELFHAFKLQQPSTQHLTKLAPRTRVALAHWQHTANAIHQASKEIGITPDLVFFAWLDSYLNPYLIYQIIDQVFPYNWSGLCFRFYQLNRKKLLSSLRRQFNLNPFTIFRSSHCQSVALLNENMVDNLKIKLKDKRVIVFPDFTDEALPDINFQITKEVINKASGRKIVGMLGSLDKRKGMLKLLEVAQLTPDYFFVFAGKFDSGSYSQQQLKIINDIVQSSPDNCYFHFERIADEAQFNALVNTCDILFAAYQNFPYSSNILTKAALFRKPIIVSKNFCMGERVRKFNLGITIDEGDTSQCIAALQKLSSQFKLDAQQQENFQKYYDLHSIKQLNKVFATVLNLNSCM